MNSTKVYFRVLRLIAVPLIDSILDAWYFLKLGNENILVHMPASVIKLMCAFLFIAALKDILMSWFIKRLLNNGPEPDADIEHTFKIFEIMTRVIHAFLNSVFGICESMRMLQQLNSFNSGLF